MIFQIKRHDGYDTCEEYGWQYLQNVFGDGIMHTYGSLVFALQYCFPLTVLVISYTAIGLKMWNSAVPGDRTSSRYVISGRHESVKKVFKKKKKWPITNYIFYFYYYYFYLIFIYIYFYYNTIILLSEISTDQH